MASTRQVTVKVHLAGSIAYVPDNGKLWALFPNGIVAKPAHWRLKDDSQFLQARPSHFALFLADKDIVVRKETTAGIAAVYEPWDPNSVPRNALYPITPTQKVVSRLLGQGIDFGFDDGNLVLRPDLQFVPDMETISCAHRWVSRRYLPGSKGFDYTGLSSAVCLNTGTLDVGGFFGGKKKRTVNFGYVYTSASGDIEFEDIVWKKLVANHLIWSVKLPEGERRIAIKNIDWTSKSQDTTVYVLEAPKRTNLIEIAIMNSELEVPILFLADPDLPVGTVGFPDPDFEIFYSISSNQSKRIPWRVPVARSGPSGTTEKPCTGGMFKGFA